MDHSYESITRAATEAIEAMAREPRDTLICDVGSLRSVAAGVYWSWACLVGQAARNEDSDRMASAIAKIPGPPTVQK